MAREQACGGGGHGVRTLRSIAVTVGVLRNLIKTAAPTVIGNTESSSRVPAPLALISSGEGHRVFDGHQAVFGQRGDRPTAPWPILGG